MSEPTSVSLLASSGGRDSGVTEPRAISIACGSNHNLALTSDNSIYSWGYGEMFALGHGKDGDELFPRRLNFEAAKIDGIRITEVSAGGQHSAIIGRVLSTR